MHNWRLWRSKLVLVILAFGGPAAAQQITGSPGSPSATTTIDGAQIPPPPQPFGGKIEPEASKSTPYWPARVVPPKGAPNVLLIITDDAGYGVSSTFGGVIPTPALDRIARGRLALHELQLDRAVLADARRADHGPQPSLGRLRRDRRAGHRLSRLQQRHHQGQGDDRARSCKDNGYRTSWFGKNHNTPEYQASQAGPFDQWPTGMGFEYFYGFMGGDTNQWEPGNLVRNTTPDLSVCRASPAGT